MWSSFGIKFLLGVHLLTNEQMINNNNRQMFIYRARVQQSYAEHMAVALDQSEVAEHTDRRVVRSRQMLVDALARLLRRKNFDEISILEITNEADLTRGTFYLHFADKAALLEAMTAARFGEMLRKRGISRVTSTSELKTFAEALCEYLAKVLDCQTSSSMPLERAVIPVIEGIFHDGAKTVEFTSDLEANTFATALAWSMYGSANRWAKTAHRPPAKKMAEVIELLLRPMLPSGRFPDPAER